jgi:hypothetical protein
MGKSMRLPVIPVGMMFLIILGACEKIQSFPPEPSIEFKEFILEDTAGGLRKGTLVFTFVDGDGNLGIYPGAPDSIRNLFLEQQEKVNGEYLPVEQIFPLHFRVLLHPNMAREGQNKTLKGEIRLRLLYDFTPWDTIRYEFYIVDNDQTKSNVEITPDIPIKFTGSITP